VRIWIVALAACALLGVVLAVAGGDTVDAIGVGLVGLAGVGAVSLGFFAVGRSEDRAREAEARTREPDGAKGAERPGDGRIGSRRPPRSRGDS
jgi:hypothetical protein